jgi:hypothetical protein
MDEVAHINCSNKLINEALKNCHFESVPGDKHARHKELLDLSVVSGTGEWRFY